MQLREITELSIVLRIVAALICGGAIGLERGLKNRPAGLRTYMLVCVGACLVMLTNQYIYQATHTGDPMRLGAQVVSGIGFLGAGTIIVTRRNQIKGLTTAAGLWSAAAVGLALGVGFYEAALIGGTAIFFVLTILQYWDDKMHNRTKVVEVYLELGSDTSLGDLIRSLRELDVEIQHIQLEQGGALENSGRSIVATLKTKKRCNHLELIDKIRTIQGVQYMEEL